MSPSDDSGAAERDLAKTGEHMEESAAARQPYREEDPAVWEAAEALAQHQPCLVCTTPDWFREQTGHSHVIIPTNIRSMASLGFGSSLEEAKTLCIELLTVLIYRHFKHGEPYLKGEPIYQELIEDPVSHQVVPNTWPMILAIILVGHRLFERWLAMGVIIPETAEGETRYSMVSPEQFKVIIAAGDRGSQADPLPPAET